MPKKNGRAKKQELKRRKKRALKQPRQTHERRAQALHALELEQAAAAFGLLAVATLKKRRPAAGQEGI